MFKVEDIKTAQMLADEKVINDTAEANALIFKELEELDNASIRDIRAYIAAKADAPKTLKDRELLATTARTKLK